MARMNNFLSTRGDPSCGPYDVVEYEGRRYAHYCQTCDRQWACDNRPCAAEWDDGKIVYAQVCAACEYGVEGARGGQAYLPKEATGSHPTIDGWWE
jgi:hypothetical protein